MSYAYNGFGYLWKKSATVIDKSGELISTVGQAVQTKLDQTGITENVAYYTNAAADKTMNIGSTLYEKTS